MHGIQRMYLSWQLLGFCAPLERHIAYFLLVLQDRTGICEHLRKQRGEDRRHLRLQFILRTIKKKKEERKYIDALES